MRSSSLRYAGASLAAVLLVSLLALAPATSAATSEPPTQRAPATLAVANVIDELNRPWDIAFTPDGTMLFTEKTGRVNARIGLFTFVIVDPEDVLVSSEGGMMGLAIDPAFETNRRIYTCMLSRADGRPDDVRVVRWTVAPDFASVIGRADIVTGIEVNTIGQLGRHSGCRPRFGPDGYLWIGTGDAAMGTHPQDPDSLAGKVLRVDGDGNGAPGNAGPPFRDEIYSYGHRNVQGIAFRPADGKAYAVEHGTNCDDEVNALVPGGNYGWNPVPEGGGLGYDESGPMTDTTAFPDAIEAAWSSGCPTIAPSGATFLSGPQWADWDGSLALAVLKDTELRVLELTPDGNDISSEEIRITDQGRLRTAVQGPDGDLYLSQDSFPGSILRVTPVGGAPCASAPFPDVSTGHPFCADIKWLADEGITGGFEDGTFRPAWGVTRQAMAAFLHRYAGEPPVTLTTPFFADVPPSHPFFGAIQWMAESGLSTGTPNPPGKPLYKPGGAITRQAMAAFIYRFADEPPFTPPGSSSFIDVALSNPFFAEIEWLADENIAGGFSDGTFRPHTGVTRQSMAAFLHRLDNRLSS